MKQSIGDLAAMDSRDAAIAGKKSRRQPDNRLPAFERGILIGILIGEGHFGGDGKQPHVTLRMHVRHEVLFRWLEARFPRARLYGPYHHGGRSYFQWMVRGRALAEDLIPELDRGLSPQLDQAAWERYRAMRSKYGRAFERLGVPALTE